MRRVPKVAQRLDPRYRARFWGEPDPLFRRSLVVSGLLGALGLGVVLLAPITEKKITSVEEIPERFARLIVEKPKPGESGRRTPAPSTEETPAVAEPEEPAIAESLGPEPRARSRRNEPAHDAGAAGRERARKEVTQTLARTTANVEEALETLTAALATSTSADENPAPRPRRRRVRSGRSAGDIAPVEVALRTSGEGPDIGGSAVGVELVALDGVGAVDGDGRAGGPVGPTGAAPGVYRSTASLAAIVRRYAAGIQFCYENELKHEPTLEGKVITVITVAAPGHVTAVSIAFDSVGSDSMRSCVLGQIRSWQFPPIAEGKTSFQVPFVFTPPK